MNSRTDSPPEGTRPIPPHWTYGDLEIRAVDTHLGDSVPERRAVVVSAADRIAMTVELLATANDVAVYPPIRGGLAIADDLVSFGTPGEGLGRLTYRIVDRAPGWVLLEVVNTSAD